jgi:hypothetical protein
MDLEVKSLMSDPEFCIALDEVVYLFENHRVVEFEINKSSATCILVVDRVLWYIYRCRDQAVDLYHLSAGHMSRHQETKQGFAFQEITKFFRYKTSKNEFKGTIFKKFNEFVSVDHVFVDLMKGFPPSKSLLEQFRMLLSL